MRIKKKCRGFWVELEIIKIKDYPRYSLYQVCRVKDGNVTPLYKECFTKLQLEEIKARGNCIYEEAFK